MKKFVFGLLAMAALLFATTHVSAQNAKKAQWKEMLDFHEVMSETFHSAENNNLAPLKEKSGLLVERAQAWKAAAVPAGYKPEVTTAVLKRLVKQCKAINKAVKKGKSDAELVASITTAHDIFHEIMEKCRE
jgi:predicted HAD superfamily Cof-like phosphohydrolase